MSALSDLGDPAIDDVAERAARARAGAELLDDLAIDVVELVKVEIVVGDDDEARREALRLGVEHREARHEGLAAAVAAAQELEDALASRRELEEPADLGALLLDADGERLQPALGDDAGAKPFEDVLAISLARHRSPSRT